MTNAKMREAFEQQFPSYSGTSEYELGYRKVWDAAYAAGRKAGMEEAARVCEVKATVWFQNADDQNRGFAADVCAASIRALAKEEG